MLFLVFIQLVLLSGRGNVKGDRNTRRLQRRLCFLLEDTQCGCFQDNGFIVVPVPGHVFCLLGLCWEQQEQSAKDLPITRQPWV